MKAYEAVFLIKSDLDQEGLDKTLGQIKEIIEKHKGSQGEVKEWGKQRLAYHIKKYKEAIYYLVSFHMEPDSISTIKRFFGLNESILRVLITTA